MNISLPSSWSQAFYLKNVKNTGISYCLPSSETISDNEVQVMSFHRVSPSTSQNTQTSQSTSQFAPRPFAVQQTPQKARMAPTQENIENQAFEQDSFEAKRLQMKAKYGTIAPMEQEKLGVLQAKMDNYWAQKLERAKTQPNLLDILIRNAPKTPPTTSEVSIQPQLDVPNLEKTPEENLQESSKLETKQFTPQIQRQTTVGDPRPHSSVYLRPFDAQTAISIAVQLFQNSDTAQTPLGSRVLAELNSLYSRGEIGLAPRGSLPPEVTARARGDENPIDIPLPGIGSSEGFDLEVNPQNWRNVIALATTLVHEALHHAMDWSEVYEEVQARSLEVDFYNELVRGIELNGETVNVTPETVDEETLRASEWRSRGQLVDYVLGLRSEGTFGYAVELSFVRTHFRNWGGISHRTMNTKIRYLQVILHEGHGNSQDAILVVDILESLSNASEFDQVVERVGGIALIRSFFSIYYPSGQTSGLGMRIRVLEDRFSNSLRLENLLYPNQCR
jgi:hypothetical protein